MRYEWRELLNIIIKQNGELIFQITSIIIIRDKFGRPIQFTKNYRNQSCSEVHMSIKGCIYFTT